MPIYEIQSAKVTSTTNAESAFSALLDFMQRHPLEQVVLLIDVQVFNELTKESGGSRKADFKRKGK